MSFPISPQCRVVLHLSLTLEDGTVAESTFGEAPLEITLGDGTLLRGLEIALYGLRPGDTQRLELTPGQTWGTRNPELVHAVPRAVFAPELELAPGQIIGFETPEGDELAGAVLEVGASSVQVDFNHPLAGHTLIFDVEILDVIPAAEQQ